MSATSITLLGAVTLCSLCGGAAFKLHADARDPLWLIAGFIAYNLSNIAWVVLIDQTGLARAVVIASAAQIVLTTVLGAFWGERIGFAGLAAAALACSAVSIAAIGNSHPTQIQSQTEEAR